MQGSDDAVRTTVFPDISSVSCFISTTVGLKRGVMWAVIVVFYLDLYVRAQLE